LNGIEAARQIREIAPQSKILFVSAIGDSDVAAEALRIGGSGYVLKAVAGRELLSAVEAVLRGEVFVSSSLTIHDLVARHRPQKVQPSRHHAVAFYPDDASFLRGVGRFVETALSTGGAVIVMATESHRESLLTTLQARGFDVADAIERGRYKVLDAADALSTVMLGGLPDPVRFLEQLGNLIATAAQAAEGGRVAIFGECVHLLWAQGNAEAAIQFEKLGNQLAKRCDVDILCGYSHGSVPGGMEVDIFRRVCAEHSVVHGLGY
jgi:DNA-binding NarL/FixJ family response regulator